MSDFLSLANQRQSTTPNNAFRLLIAAKRRYTFVGKECFCSFIKASHFIAFSLSQEEALINKVLQTCKFNLKTTLISLLLLCIGQVRERCEIRAMQTHFSFRTRLFCAAQIFQHARSF